MIGLDTSHSVEFARRLAHPGGPGHVPGARIASATVAFSGDMAWSVERVEGFVRELREEHGVRIVDGIPEVVSGSDAILICSLDGRTHLEQFRACAVGKPVFLDKPVAASLREAVEIYRIAEATGTPVFSASALRWQPEVVEVALAEVGRVAGAISYGPAPLEPHHPDLFFYGMHAVEALFTVMGPGCVSVTRVATERASVVAGPWEDGSLGSLYAMHHWPGPYRVVKMGDREVAGSDVRTDYTPLLREIVEFCRTGVAPVRPAQTLEIYAFMEAADESRRRGGVAVTLAEVMASAR